ncbi:hypothetical protein SRHO_G00128340 [Serrasalmus rhombeus]
MERKAYAHTQTPSPTLQSKLFRSQFKRNSWQNDIWNNGLIYHPNLTFRILSPPAISRTIQTEPSLSVLTRRVEGWRGCTYPLVSTL